MGDFSQNSSLSLSLSLSLSHSGSQNLDKLLKQSERSQTQFLPKTDSYHTIGYNQSRLYSRRLPLYCKMYVELVRISGYVIKPLIYKAIETFETIFPFKELRVYTIRFGAILGGFVHLLHLIMRFSCFLNLYLYLLRLVVGFVWCSAYAV